MIQLYKKTNTNYSYNGDFSLKPIGDARLNMVINSSWTLSLTIDAKCEAAKYFEHDAVVAFTVPRYGKQYYVINNPKKTDFETITADCYPVGQWDAMNELILRDCRPTNMTAQAALNWMLSAAGGTGKYSVSSDLTTRSTAYYQNKNFIQALNSDEDNSFVNRWGGQIVYNNWKIEINQSAGQDNGLRLSLSKNISGIEVDEDDSSFLDTIIPVAYNGRTYPNEVVDTSRRQKYRTAHRGFVTYDWIKLAEDANEEEEDGVIVCGSLTDLYTELEKAAKADFDAGMYNIAHSYSIDYLDTFGLEEWDGYEASQRLWLGDTVYCYNLDDNVEEKQQVIELTYDIVTGKVTDIVLGTYVNQYYNSAHDIITAAGNVIDTGTMTVMAEKVAGLINAANAQLKAQYDAATETHYPAMITQVTDESNPLFGCLCYGTQGIMLSKRKKADGSWDFSTCITAAGIIADYIVTGLLTDKTGNFYLNLDTGYFELGEGLFKGTISTLKNAKIGKRIYLDYDTQADSGSYLTQSGMYLGNEGSEIGPYIAMYDRGESDSSYWSQLKLGVQNKHRTYTGRAPGLTVLDQMLTSGGTITRSASLSANGDNYLALDSNDATGSNGAMMQTGRLALNVSSLVINGKAGITYSGKVSSITTTNGIVTAVSA